MIYERNIFLTSSSMEDFLGNYHPSRLFFPVLKIKGLVQGKIMLVDKLWLLVDRRILWNILVP